MAKSDVEAMEKGSNDRDKTICVAHAYVWTANQSLWRRLNNAHGEADARSSKDLLWRRSIVVKAVDNAATTSKGEKTQRVAN